MYPIIINNRNRLTTTKNMVEKLLSLNPNDQIIIIDNGSTYEPLLDWYYSIQDKIEIIWGKNEGHLALWALRMNKRLPELFVYTDSDIELNENFPKDWKQIMSNYYHKYGFEKVALGIKIDDIPEHYRYINQVKRNEGVWWLNELEPKVYTADTDTTFSLIKNTGNNPFKSIRLCQDNMISRHIPWYIDLANLDEEEKYYLDNHDNFFTTQYTKQHIEPTKFTDI